MSDKNNEFINLYEFLDNTPVSQLTHTELSNLIDGISNTWVTMMHDGKHDFDEENVRQGFNHLFRYKAVRLIQMNVVRTSLIWLLRRAGMFPTMSIGTKPGGLRLFN